MDTLEILTQQVMDGHQVTREEALWLSKQPLEHLVQTGGQNTSPFLQKYL